MDCKYSNITQKNVLLCCQTLFYCDLKRRLNDNKESDSLLQTSSCTGSSSFTASITAKSGSQARDKPHQKRHTLVGDPQTSDMNTRSEDTQVVWNNCRWCWSAPITAKCVPCLHSREGKKIDKRGLYTPANLPRSFLKKLGFWCNTARKKERNVNFKC